MSEIEIHFSHFGHVHDRNPSERGKKRKIVSSRELKQWMYSGRICFHLFRYQTSLLKVFDHNQVPRPFISALLTWCLARKKAFQIDHLKEQKQISFKTLCSLFVNLVKSACMKKKTLKKVEKDLAFLAQKVSQKTTLDLSKPPVYLRTDLSYGLLAGGSVGHIAGVVNNLKDFSSNPIFLTTDKIPTVSSECETHLISPPQEFADFRELPGFYMNQVFPIEAKEKIGKRRPSFIYQRYSLNNYSGVHLSDYYQVPFVLEFNGSEIWVNRNWSGSRLKYETLSEKIETLNFNAADLIVVVSAVLKNQLIDRGIKPEKILVNPNGVNPEKYSPTLDGQNVRKSFHLEEKIVIGFIGTFGAWHGAEILAKAYMQLLALKPQLAQKIHLLLIGDGVTMPNVKTILGGCEEYTSTGLIEQKEGPSYLAACDILVSPQTPNQDGSPFFGSPTKLFEYMAMGKAIVASDLDQIGEVLEDGKDSLLTKPGDVESLTQALEKLIEDRALREKLGRAAREKVIAKYTWHIHTEKIINKLKEVLG